MDRLTVRIPSALHDDLETIVESGYYPGRSEAVRDGLRALLNGNVPFDGTDDLDEDWESTTRLNVRLPEPMLATVRQHADTDTYSHQSEVIRAGIRTLVRLVPPADAGETFATPDGPGPTSYSPTRLADRDWSSIASTHGGD